MARGPFSLVSRHTGAGMSRTPIRELARTPIRGRYPEEYMNNATDIQSSVVEPKRRSRLADFFVRLVREKPLGTISGIIVLIFIFVAIFADSLAPFPYDEVNILDRMQGPSAEYLLGTDQLGRDLLSRLIVGLESL